MDPIICFCHTVRQDSIKQAIRYGANTIHKIGELTRAGTGCSSCHPELELILYLTQQEIKKELEEKEKGQLGLF